MNVAAGAGLGSATATARLQRRQGRHHAFHGRAAESQGRVWHRVTPRADVMLRPRFRDLGHRTRALREDCAGASCFIATAPRGRWSIRDPGYRRVSMVRTSAFHAVRASHRTPARAPRGLRSGYRAETARVAFAVQKEVDRRCMRRPRPSRVGPDCAAEAGPGAVPFQGTVESNRQALALAITGERQGCSRCTREVARASRS